MEWMPIETCPKDQPVLLFGLPYGASHGATFKKPLVLSGYYDLIDDAWCSTTADWTGPFIAATHWLPLPPPPTGEQE